MGDETGTRTRTLREINEALDKLARRTEADRERAEADREADRKRAEADRERSEREWREIRERSARLDEEMAAMSKAADKRSAEADKRMDALHTLFTGQWGRLVESLVRGGAVRMFREWGIEVVGIAPERSRTHLGKIYEYDIILENGEEMVVVEVKSTLDMDGAERFKRKLAVFTDVFSEYRGRKIHGALAFLRANGGMDRRGQRMGFFVIKATGDGAVLLNAKKGVFAPKEFSGRAES